jgi:hypothetical protein
MAYCRRTAAASLNSRERASTGKISINIEIKWLPTCRKLTNAVKNIFFCRKKEKIFTKK